MQCVGVLEYWSTGVLGLKAEKHLIFIVSPLRYRNPYMVPICPLSLSLFIPLLRHSKTPVLLIRLTASYDKEWMTAVYKQL
jgi:hypothetical protein